MHSFSFEAIGTHWTIDLPQKSQSIQSKLFQTIKDFDLTYSRFKSESYFSSLSIKAGKYKAPSDFEPLKNIYLKLYALTDGLFTPLVASLLEETGYDKNYSLKPKKLTPVAKLADKVKFYNDTIEILSPTSFDFGAAGKGYLVDKLTELLSTEGIDEFIIDAGGDIYVKKNSPIRIALEHPESKNKAIGVATIANNSICSSAGNRRKWNKFHHILNPKTLKSSNEVLSTWVVSNQALEADALATALFLLPDPNKFKDFKFEYVILYKDYKALISNNFPGQIFTK